MIEATELARKSHALLRGRLPQMIADIQRLVELESPTLNKPAADALGRELAGRFQAMGAKVKISRQKQVGDHLTAHFAGGRSQQPILLLGHFDTVWDVGTLKSMPCRVSGGKLTGPGVFDMKAGIVLGMHALEAMREAGGGLPRPVIFHLVSDEEMGSDSSRALTEEIARGCAAVLVLEPAGPGGAVKTARKGVGGYTVRVRGVPSHAGLDFEKGQSAIIELARQIIDISELADLKRGLTVNPGVIRGGTRSNVVAAEAEVEVDVRISNARDAAQVERMFRKLKPKNRKCALEVTGGINRPPLERSPQVSALYETAREVARPLGVRLGEVAVGGGSDGNFTAGLGIPTLDGLGAIGDGAHAHHEHVVVAELPRRAALIAALIAAVAQR